MHYVFHCLIIEGFVDENFRINITPHVPRLPPVGTDLQLVCEVDNPQGFQRPVWVKPNGERVGQGESYHKDRVTFFLTCSESICTV